MASTYYALSDFFPAIDQAEALELISILPGTGETQDIFQLAACPPRELAPHLDKAKLKDAYATSLQEQAVAVLPEITPVNPGNPTPEEQIAILGGLNLFYSAWPDVKQSALRSVIQRIADHNKLTESYEILGKVASMSLLEIQGFMEGDTYDALARYYIVMAGRYIARDLKHYTVAGQVTDTGNVPMPGVQVRLEDGNVAIPRQSGAAFTNDQGYFRSSFSSMEEDMTKYDIEGIFTHPRLSPSTQSKSIAYDSAQPNKIHSFAFGFNPIPSSSKTVASTGTAIPADVQTYLNTQGITVTRLEDIRRLGGFINLPTDAIDKDNTNLLKLDGLANLELANADVPNNDTLYARGYTSISRIANTPRKDFVAQNRDVLGDFVSAQVHARARAAHLYALNALADNLSVQPAGEISRGIPILVGNWDVPTHSQWEEASHQDLHCPRRHLRPSLTAD